MLEINGDLWDFDCDYRCVTTNGIVKQNGQLVMGKGVAFQAQERFPDLPSRLGALVRTFGNRPFRLVKERLISFPTKYDWRHKSSLQLIEKSAKLIRMICDKFRIQSVGMTRPGCGNGGLVWDDVRKVIEPHFDDRFVVLNTD